MKIEILTAFAVLLFSAFGAAALERPRSLRRLARKSPTSRISGTRERRAVMRDGVVTDGPM